MRKNFADSGAVKKTPVRRGMLIVISGPSGTGKGTLCDRLIKTDENITFSVSATTRRPRETEKDGVHYHFLTNDQFDKLLQEDNFLEYAVVHDHRYGTPKKPVLEALEQGKDILLDIDTQGALSVMEQIKDCVSIFILPPTFSSLRSRLHTRNTDDEAEIRKRLNNARDEIEKYVHYDYALINDELESAFQRLESIIASERIRTLRFHPEIPE
ncbi:MAG: guanylate kinase [Bacillota bacterium]|nr:guanylate kinase [Bacillota bacterium]